MTERNRKTLIRRYLNNTATLNELEVFFKEMEDPEFIKLLEDESSHNFTKKELSVAKIAIAASIVFAFAFSYLFFFKTFFESNRHNPLVQNGKVLSIVDSTVVVEYGGTKVKLNSNSESLFFIDSISKLPTVDSVSVTTPSRLTYSLDLPDGTRVNLNSNSTIVFPKVFSKGRRWANVSGEVFFDVKSDKNNPFYVKTISKENQLAIAVTGTKFNVKSYSSDNLSAVSLFDGRVNVNNVDIIPGQKYHLNSKGAQVEVFDLDKERAWLEGKFVFDNNSLSVILRELEKWYGVRFEMRGVQNDVTFGGTISKKRELNFTLNREM